MEHIKVAKVPPTPLLPIITWQVDNVELLSRGTPTLGTLHLTAHHLIFSSTLPEGEKPREMWVCYPIIHTVERRQPLSLGVDGCALRFRCRDFNFFTLGFRNEAEGKDVFESVAKLTCVGTCKVV
jgi:myotubularin-related protein 6/7/8